MKCSYKVIGSILTIFVINGCADVNSGIRSFNETLYGVENAASGVYEQNISKAFSPLPSKTAKKNVMQAYENMQKGLSIIACTKKGNGDYSMSRLSRYTIDGKVYYIGRFPQSGSEITKHTDGCLVIERINGYKDIDINAFSVNVTFTSAQTGESSQRRYQMVQENGGEWLFNFN
ncbi:MAG: hypothetical protein NT103_01540 [Campylobacterales bacterium]|nr:hypothetical protein [Campylobacterales bacterium]